MAYPDLKSFLHDIRSTKPEDLIREWLAVDVPHAFGTSADYRSFVQLIHADWPKNASISVAGTSNWRYSLNPQKNFSEYHEKSDIDVVIVSPTYFAETWERLRGLHRKRWYTWSRVMRENVSRTGTNVYCGFISPKHIPEKSDSYRFAFLSKCNSYSTALVGYRDVNMMFFKSEDDAVDYYVRGVRLAKRSI